MTDARNDIPPVVLRLPDLTAADHRGAAVKSLSGHLPSSGAIALRNSLNQPPHADTSPRWGRQLVVAVAAAALTGVAIFIIQQERSEDRASSRVRLQESAAIEEPHAAATTPSVSSDAHPTNTQPAPDGEWDTEWSGTVAAYEPQGDQPHPAASINLSTYGELTSTSYSESHSDASSSPSIDGPRLVSGNRSEMEREQLAFSSIPVRKPVARFTGGIIPMPTGGSSP